MDIEVIKKNFDYYRQQKGLKIDDICAALGGITRQALYNYMKKGISFNSICKIAAALDVEPWQLLKPADEQQQTTTTSEAQTICPHCGKPIKITLI